MPLFEIVTVAALVIGPIVGALIAFGLQRWSQNKAAIRAHKEYVFNQIMATRGGPDLQLQTVQAMNMIDVAFGEDAEVRRIWKEYYDLLLEPVDPQGKRYEQWEKKRNELLHAMAKAIGYGKSLQQWDVDRVYRPVGLWKEREDQATLSVSLTTFFARATRLLPEGDAKEQQQVRDTKELAEGMQKILSGKPLPEGRTAPSEEKQQNSPSASNGELSDK